jgi:hypothetical protein
MTPTIDPKLAAALRPLAADELQALESSLVENGGARDPIVTWRGFVLDGHNRLDICKRRGLRFETIEARGIDTHEQAVEWIHQNQ